MRPGDRDGRAVVQEFQFEKRIRFNIDRAQGKASARCKGTAQ
jgi:hypothetical protein